MNDLSLASGCVARCRGCAHRSLSAAQSAQQKLAWLERRLAPWAERLTALQAVSGEARWHYRERVTLACAWSDHWRIGLRVNDEVVGIEHCPVHSLRVNAAIAALRDALPPPAEFPLVYFVQSGAQLVLVLKSARLPALDWLDDDLRQQLHDAGIEGLWLHLFPSAGHKVLTKSGWQLLWGTARSRDAQGLWYGPAAFQQLLPGLHRRALDEAADFLAPQSGDGVIDLYCGAGSSLRRWDAAGAATLGVESGGEAIACARLNVPTAQVLRGNCATRLPQLRQWGREHGGQRLLYANPPRTGLEAEVLDWLAGEYRPQRLAYLSCSAGTLARDLAVLQQQGYLVERLTPYDFFPQTHHVEVLALLNDGQP